MVEILLETLTACLFVIVFWIFNLRRKKKLNLIDLLTAFAKISVIVKPKTGPDSLSFYRGEYFMQNPIPVHAKIILEAKQTLMNRLCTRFHILKGAKKPKATGVIINRGTEHFAINVISYQGHRYAFSESFHFLGVFS